jgi:tRNA1(Val) A37 N6-methylase TrmN6
MSNVSAAETTEVNRNATAQAKRVLIASPDTSVNGLTFLPGVSVYTLEMSA